MEIEPNFREGVVWEAVGKIQIQSRVSLSDSSYFYDQPLVVDLEPRVYLISVRYATLDGHRRVAKARLAVSEEALRKGCEIGVVGVDFGQIGICDRDSVEAAFDILGDDGMSKYFDQLNITELTGTVRLPGEALMYIFRPGFGDGNYPVYELLDLNGRRSGLEIDCALDVE